MFITILLLIITTISFWGAFGWLIQSWYGERKAEKEFEKRQEQYRKMI